MVLRHELMQGPGFARGAETVRLRDLVAFRVEEDENRRIRKRHDLPQLVSFRIAARRIRLEYREVFRVDVLQLPPGELAGDVPATASVLA